MIKSQKKFVKWIFNHTFSKNTSIVAGRWLQMNDFDIFDHNLFIKEVSTIGMLMQIKFASYECNFSICLKKLAFILYNWRAFCDHGIIPMVHNTDLYS